MGNQFTNIFSNYKLERVKILGVSGLGLPFYLTKRVRNLFLFFLLLDQKEAKLKAERCFCPQALRWPAVLPGRSFFSIPFLYLACCMVYNTTPPFGHPSFKGGESVIVN